MMKTKREIEKKSETKRTTYKSAGFLFPLLLFTLPCNCNVVAFVFIVTIALATHGIVDLGFVFVFFSRALCFILFTIFVFASLSVFISFNSLDFNWDLCQNVTNYVMLEFRRRIKYQRFAVC